MSALHDAARNFAQAGIPVFPCLPNDKRPACANGFHDATTNLTQIDAWWTDNPNYNLALCPETAGWSVIDIESDGLAYWNTHTPEVVPATYTVRTPRGGQHLYFEGSLPSSVRKLFPGQPIDTRGAGGYVLAPPSIVNGKAYTVERDTDLARLPAWIASTLASRNSKAAAAVEQPDLPGNIARGRSLLANYVSRDFVAVAGQGGNNRSYQVACEVFNFGLSPATVYELIRDEWNPHCVPPWSDDELRTIVANAAAYAQNEPGAWAVAPAGEVFGEALGKLGPELLQPVPAKRSRFYAEDDDEMDATPAANWLVPDVLQEATTVMMVGPTQSYKSFVALDLALGVATGAEIFGRTPVSTGPTFYAALEGRADIKRKRRPAWRMAHEIAGKTDFYVLVAPMIVFPEEVQEFGDAIRARCGDRQPKLIVLDTTSKMMVGLDPTRDAPRFIRFCDSLVEAFGCTVIAIHHTGHDVERGPRDSSAYQAGFDTVLQVTSPAKLTIEVKVTKHKDNEEPEAPFTFEGTRLAGSLVFHPSTRERHAELTHEDDPLDTRKVGAALKKLGAVGAANGVTTHVLASELAAVRETDSADARQTAIERTGRQLGALVKSRLQAYCEGSGRERLWFLPN